MRRVHRRRLGSFSKKDGAVVANSYGRPAAVVREAATLPLIVRVLFIACVAMLAGNALVLILNLETTRRSNAVST